jgi:hypothetical protein
MSIFEEILAVGSSLQSSLMMPRYQGAAGGLSGTINTALVTDEDLNMRTIGHRKERHISFSASGTLLAEGARFNDETHPMPTGNTTFVPKGLYRFKTFEDANRHEAECLARGMARLALARS